MQQISFSFGQNWKNFSKTIDAQVLERATEDIREWFSLEGIQNKRVLDIGSGSGIHSYAFWKLGASEVVSFDYDFKSVEATDSIWKKCRQPSNWKVLKGSILDKAFIESLGQFDIVYSWGVLHHTGQMWEAIKNAISIPIKEDSKIMISIYQDKKNYERDLSLKMNYNKAGFIKKKYIVLKQIYMLMSRRRRKGLNPFTWNEKKERGMNEYHDLIDWLGGLPYEVATKEEIERFFSENGGWRLKKNDPSEACHVYLFSKV